MGKSERENELAALEARLGAFHPGASRLDRDQVMYMAGQAAALKQRADAGSRQWAWPSAFAAMTTVAAALLVALVMGRQEGGVLPSAPGGRLAQETGRAAPPEERVVQETPTSTDFAQPRFSDFADSHWPGEPDLDALLAQLPAGRGLSQKAPWEGIDPGWSAEAGDSAASDRPVTYVKHRRMLLEELMPAKGELPMRTES